MTKTNATTQICGFDADTVVVRKSNLVSELIGHVSFIDMFFLQSLGKKPNESQSRIVESVMVGIMEHGLVPSAIVTRMTHYGAPESFQGAVAAGLLGVGDRYAGTAGECGALLERIVAEPADQRHQAALDIVREYRASRRPVPGFGHPIHSENDARVARLLEIAEACDTPGEHIAAMRLLESALSEILGKQLVTNISAAIGAVLAEAGIPSGMMRGVVLIARCAGLVGHLHEEQSNPAAHAMWEGAQSRVDYTP